MLEQLKFYIAEGLERNIMCYDSEANGKLTKRLIGIMRTAYKHNTRGPIEQIIFNYNDLDFELKGMGFDYIIGVENWIGLNEYFEKNLGGSFPKGTSNLILMVGEQTLLGAY